MLNWLVPGCWLTRIWCVSEHNHSTLLHVEAFDTETNKVTRRYGVVVTANYGCKLAPVICGFTHSFYLSASVSVGEFHSVVSSACLLLSAVPL